MTDAAIYMRPGDFTFGAPTPEVRVITVARQFGKKVEVEYAGQRTILKRVVELLTFQDGKLSAMAQTELRFRESALSPLSELYDEIRGPEAVEAYLREYPVVTPILLHAAAPIHQYFGLDSRTAIELVADPENGDSPELFVWIYTVADPEHAIATEFRFLREWVIPNTDDAIGLVYFGVGAGE